MAILAQFRGKYYFYSHIKTCEKWSVKSEHQKNCYIFSKKANGPFAFFSPKKSGALKNFLFSVFIFLLHFRPF